MKKTGLFFLLLCVSVFRIFPEIWPLGPGNVLQEIGNNGYAYQQYISPANFHAGIDILCTGGDPCYAVCDGVVDFYQDGGDHFSILIINDNATTDQGWLYLHINPFVSVGDPISEGDYIGDIQSQLPPTYNHLTLIRSRYPGTGNWYDAVDNAIEFLVPSAETDAPVFEDTEPGQRFSFVENNTCTPVDPANVTGDVDIIAKVSDYIGGTTWGLVPYSIEWSIYNSASVEVMQRLFVTFTGAAPDNSLLDVVYKTCSPWDSKGDYTNRDYYFIITNTDNDGTVEATDAAHAFSSNSLGNGDYTLCVTAEDFAGNSTTECMSFTINNPLPTNPLDIVQVLDRSGSMNGYTTSLSTDRKLDVMKYAANLFIDMMAPDIGSRLGIVQFNEDVVPFPPPDPDLKELISGTSGNVQDYHDAVDTITSGGATSIGDGLDEALNQISSLTSPNTRQAILLVSDGKENRSQLIADVQPDLITATVPVYTLGLGYSTGIDENKLTDLATATGGDYRITCDDLIFRKFFLEILAEAADLSVIVDPIGYANYVPTDTDVPVAVNDRSVIITAFWEGMNADNGLDLTLVTPSNMEITPATTASGIRYVEHERYALYQLDFPLGGDLAGEHAGDWKARVVKMNYETDMVRYAVEAFSTARLRMDMVNHLLHNLTGDQIDLGVKLTVNGVPVTGAEVSVLVDIPLDSIDNLFYREQIDLSSLSPEPNSTGDTLSPADRKLDILADRYQGRIIQRRTEEILLFDDGEHGDGQSNDGIYGNFFTNTTMPGHYNLTYKAKNINSAETMVTRELNRTVCNTVDFQVDHSVMDVTAVIGQTPSYDVKIVPKDRFGNYLGTGHTVTAAVMDSSGLRREILLQDNIDGTYTETITLNQFEASAGAGLSITIDGSEFTAVTPPAPIQVLIGDVNCDGVINIIDALLIAQYYVGLIDEFPCPEGMIAADVNCDGRIDIVDALLVAQYYVGLLQSLPC